MLGSARSRRLGSRGANLLLCKEDRERKKGKAGNEEGPVVWGTSLSLNTTGRDSTGQQNRQHLGCSRGQGNRYAGQSKACGTYLYKTQSILRQSTISFSVSLYQQ